MLLERKLKKKEKGLLERARGMSVKMGNGRNKRWSKWGNIEVREMFII